MIEPDSTAGEGVARTHIDQEPAQVARELTDTVPGVDAIADGLPALQAPRQGIPTLMGQLTGSPGVRYTRGEEVGEGAMGTVNLAEDHDLGRMVAMKRLKSEKPSPTVVRRFLREAQITGQLEHPSIVPVHDVGFSADAHFYYTMRYVPGDQTLRRVIDRLAEGDADAHELFSFERRVRVVQRVAEALQHAHERGVLHRDVKPENILLGTTGEVYLVDWGVAKVVGEPEPDSPAETGPRKPDTVKVKIQKPGTRAGAIVGTPTYMPPEQFFGHPDERSDVYALTAVLYELLCLNHYLSSTPGSMAELCAKAASDVPIPAENFTHGVNGRVPRALSLICERGLAKDPGERFQTARELEEAIQEWLEGISPVVCPTTFTIRRLHDWRRALDRYPFTFTFLSIFVPGLALLSVALHVLQLVLWSLGW